MLEAKKKNFVIIGLLILLFAIVTGMAYAAFNYVNTSEANSIKTGKISMSYTEPTNAMELIDALPMSDTMGIAQTTFFEFNVSSHAMTNVNDDKGLTLPYEINISKVEIEQDYEPLLDSDVKIHLIEVISGVEIERKEPTLVSNLSKSNLEEERIVVYETADLHKNASSTKVRTYRLRTWIDDNFDFTLLEKNIYQYKFRVNINSQTGALSNENTSNEESYPEPIPEIIYSTTNWTSGNVSVTVNFDQEDVIITNNDGSNIYIFNQNGSFSFKYTYNAGQTGTVTTAVNWIDKTAPVITSAGNPNENTWTNENITITPVVNETGSGFDKFLWNIDGGNWTEDWSGIFTEDINATIGIIAVDKVNNQSTPIYTSLKIDKTAPVITMNGSSSVTIGLNDSYFDQGATVNDNFSTGLNVVVTGNVIPSIEGTYYIYYNATDWAGNEAIQLRRTVYVTADLNLQRYATEMAIIETLILDINENERPRIGTALTEVSPINIRGIDYYNKWYLVTASDLLAIDPGLDISHAPYITRYELTPGAVISIAGEVINGSPIHTFNYTGDPETYSIYTGGLLTAVTQNSPKTASTWGEAAIGSGATQTPPTVTPGGGSYDEYGGLKLGDKVGFLSIDQNRPVGERFSINVTVKGSINQDAETYGAAIIAISDANSQYLAWVRIRSGYLQVITYSTNNQTGLTGNTKGTGFMSKAIPVEYHDNFMNIQITSSRSGTAKVYLNGELFETFSSGSSVLSYGNMTIGDLRPARGLKYVGSVYNFALYSEIIDQGAVTQNWNYVKHELGQ